MKCDPGFRIAQKSLTNGQDLKVRLPSFSCCANSGIGIRRVVVGHRFLFAKVAFCEMSVSTNVALRFCFGSLFFSRLLFRRTRRFTRGDFWTMLLASIVGIPLQFLIQFKGTGFDNSLPRFSDGQYAAYAARSVSRVFP